MVGMQQMGDEDDEDEDGKKPKRVTRRFAKEHYDALLSAFGVNDRPDEAGVDQLALSLVSFGIMFVSMALASTPHCALRMSAQLR
jgi:hypothetical protein